MIQELIKAFFIIFVAEMGDKTQILAMAFATKYPVKKVLFGIFLGSLLNHSLAVILGSYISNFIPINTIQIVAGFAFVAFALWTLKSEEEDEEEEKQKNKFGPVLTVAIAFFIGELGDKTQLTAITLATDAVYPVFILGGTVLGMIVTGGLGIIIGKTLGDRIPEVAIKLIAAAVFMFFGVTKLYQTVPSQYLSVQNMMIFAIIITVAVIYLLRPMIINRRQGKESALVKSSRRLHDYYQQVEKNIEQICLGLEDCGECMGDNCIVGHTKTLVKCGLDERAIAIQDALEVKRQALRNDYNREKVLESLKMTLDIIKENPKDSQYENIHEIRKNLETMLFGESIEQLEDWNEYTKQLKRIDTAMAGKLILDLEK